MNKIIACTTPNFLEINDSSDSCNAYSDSEASYRVRTSKYYRHWPCIKPCPKVPEIQPAIASPASHSLDSRGTEEQEVSERCIRPREKRIPCIDELLLPLVDKKDELLVQVTPVKYPAYIVESSFLNREDTIRMWDLISKFIERRIENRQGVSLPNLGILTLYSHKFQVGNDLYYHEMKPVFIVRGKFALLHRLQRSQVRTSSDIPTVQLNFSTLARLLAVDRDRVEMAYCESLEKISSLLRSGQKVVLPFRSIGHLVFYLETVRMHFLPSFRKRFEKKVKEKGACALGFRSFLP